MDLERSSGGRSAAAVPRRTRTGARGAATIAAALLFASAPALAVRGAVTEHRAPSGVVEHCVALDRVPGGVYAPDHEAREREFCAVDFYAGRHALCPKAFSTSPGTLLYDLSGGDYEGRVEAFEAEHCGSRSAVKPGARGEPVSFKMTMNDRRTSATFSTASLLYYHFSRYLDAAVHVPVAVYRTMDRATHLARVVQPGLRLTEGSRALAMNHAGWEVFGETDRDPEAYAATDELYTADRTQIFGVLLHPVGRRYGPELNGTRASGWGAGQNRDFQETAPFLALRSELPLLEAIRAGLEKARRDPELRKAMGADVSELQMAYWMQELTEITLLDYIFSQQDRIGNIDYRSYWHWADGGEVHRRPADGTDVPADLRAFSPLRLKRTQLNDNDAGGRVPYANFTKTTGMLEKIRHYRPETYRRILRLAEDFEAQGELHAYLRDTFGLSPAQLRQAVNNTLAAAEILAASCRAGRLRFDLDPEALLLTGEAVEAEVDCADP